MTIHLRNAHHEFEGRSVAEVRRQARHLLNLGKTFRISCDQCRMLVINGVAIHERGCPAEWREHPAECQECGCEFEPDQAGQRLCPSCAEPALDLEPDDP